MTNRVTGPVAHDTAGGLHRKGCRSATVRDFVVDSWTTTVNSSPAQQAVAKTNRLLAVQALRPRELETEVTNLETSGRRDLLHPHVRPRLVQHQAVPVRHTDAPPRSRSSRGLGLPDLRQAAAPLVPAPVPSSAVPGSPRASKQLPISASSLRGSLLGLVGFVAPWHPQGGRLHRGPLADRSQLRRALACLRRPDNGVNFQAP